MSFARTLITPDSADSARIETPIDKELVKLLYSQSIVSQVGALGIVIVTASAFWDGSDKTLVAGWLLYMLSTVALRFRLQLAYKNGSEQIFESAKQWEMAYFAAVIVSALGWGACGVLFFRADSLAQQIFLIGMIAGVSAGAVPLLSASLRSTYVLLLLAVTPIAVKLLTAGDIESRYLGVLSILFVAIMAVTGRRSHSNTRDMLAIQSRNDALIAQLQYKTKALEHSQALIDAEMDFALSIFDSINPVKSLSAKNVTYHLSSQSAFNGDILLMATRPDGRQHFMLGDFTGHGLAASIGALPVADIFLSMTRKGFKINEIASEVNRRLYCQLPANFFLAACIAEVDASRGRLRTWNGGLPSVYVLHGDDGTIKHRLNSDHPPLGILPPDTFDRTCQLLQIKDQDQLFMATDGVVEQTNAEGEMFGEARLEKLLNDIHDISELTSTIRAELESFCVEGNQNDDITFIAIRAETATHTDAIPTPYAIAMDVDLAPQWTMDIAFEAGSLKHINPAPLVNHLIQELRGSQQGLDEFQLVLTELYNNALDHGVLGMKSELKDLPNGLMDYYELRNKLLHDLETGTIDIEISCQASRHDSILELCITDTGAGFDHQQFARTVPKDSRPYGRGLTIVHNLCHQVEYEGCGNRVRALYRCGTTSE